MKFTLPVAGAIVAGLVAFNGVATANTDPADQQGGKAKIHHTKVYTVADESARIIKDVEERAYEVTDHAGTIRAASSVPAFSRDLHALELEAITEDVNQMGKELARLEAMQDNETTWERKTVARTKPLLKQVAASADEAIRYVREYPDSLAMQQYQKLAKNLYDQSTALWNSLHDSVKLANLREREIRLRKDLQKAGKTTD